MVCSLDPPPLLSTECRNHLRHKGHLKLSNRCAVRFVSCHGCNLVFIVRLSICLFVCLSVCSELAISDACDASISISPLSFAVGGALVQPHPVHRCGCGSKPRTLKPLNQVEIGSILFMFCGQPGFPTARTQKPSLCRTSKVHAESSSPGADLLSVILTVDQAEKEHLLGTPVELQKD